MKTSNNFHTRIVDKPKLNGKTFKPLRKHTPDWKTPPYYFHMSLRWNFQAL